MNNPAYSFDVRAWLIWVLAGSVAAMLARNPVYTLIILVAARLVDWRCSRPDQSFNLPFGRLAVLVLAVSALFNVAFVHLGERVLFRLPLGWPLIGGAFTVEAIVAGLVNGLVILALLALFLTFNAVVRTGDLVRLVPNAFHDLGVVLLIALTYVPETARHWQRIQEAQVVRGHRLRGWRDWRPLIVPLFVGGLERALTLSEALVARGFNPPAGQPAPNLRRGLFLVVLMLALLGWGLALWNGWTGWLLLVIASFLLVGLIWQAGRGVPRTRYRPGRWQIQDTLLAAIGGMVLLVLLLASGTDLQYVAIPRLSAPVFNPVVGLALMLLAYPAVASS